MYGINITIIHDVFRQNSGREIPLEAYWPLIERAGGFTDPPYVEAQALQVGKTHMVGLWRNAYNADCRKFGELGDQIHAKKKKKGDPPGPRPEQAWKFMTADEQSEVYKIEYCKKVRQEEKLADLYDSATNDFGAAHARRFKQLTLDFPRPTPPMAATP